MNIISNNYENVLKEMIFKQFSDNLRNKLNNSSVFNYINLLSDLDSSLCEIARKSLITIFESIDKSYSISSDRKRYYHVKAHLPRTLLTIFGEITFTRTFYTDRFNNGSFCYLDRFLGLKKYDYFDPYIKAVILEYSANNSIPTVCKMVNDFIGNRISLKDKIKYLNRQTVRNIILDSIISIPASNYLDTPKTLYIIADEKWIHSQNNDNSNIMVKSIVVFDGISGTKRRHLSNKHIFASFDNSFLDNTIDYLYSTYDLDLVNNVVIMGDGASWIKNLTNHFKFNSNTNVIFALDKFHFKQALHHITLNKGLDNILLSYVLNNDEVSFVDCCDSLSLSYSYRSTTIKEKTNYILSNWKYISNLFKYNLSCPMESQISHNLAYLLSSRPKGYSLSMLSKIINIRLLFKNNYNIKSLYLNNFNSNDILTYNKEIINFDVFDRFKQFIPTYHDKLFTPNYISYI